jgi:hypothetical protein
MLVDDFPVRQLMDEDVQKIAFAWRERLNLFFLGNTLDIVALFEAVGSEVKWPIRVEARPDSAMGRANAFVSKDRGTVFFRKGLIDDAAQGDSEAVFDAVHELGHIILHRAEIPLARMASRNNQHKFLPPEESAEHQANVFARSFLMTDEEVERYPSADALAENCFTPLKQAVLRLEEYERTTGRRKRKAEGSRAYSDDISKAKLMGYEFAPCPECRNLTLIREGPCLVCVTCGGTSGCS